MNKIQRKVDKKRSRSPFFGRTRKNICAFCEVQASRKRGLKNQLKQLAAQLISSLVKVTHNSKLTWIRRVQR